VWRDPARAAALTRAAAQGCLAALACAAIQLAGPAAAGARQLQAFLLTSSPDSFADLRAHVGAINVVYPTYFECSPTSGYVLGAANPEIDAYTTAHGIVEMPRFTCQDGAVVHRILTYPALRARVLAQLVGLAAAPSYSGLNLDLENDGARDRDALSSFAADLAAHLHAERRKLAVDVVGVTHETLPRPTAGFYDDRALSAVADTIFVMAWGTHWEGSGPGPLAPLSFVRGVARYVASLPHARRFVLGVPMYGLDWSVSHVGPYRVSASGVAAGSPHAANPGHAVALQYAEVSALARAVGATPVRDPVSGEMTFTYSLSGVAHRVWYMDARAILERLRIATSYGLAAGVWRLGEEAQGVWS
jgi:spore germination protein